MESMLKKKMFTFSLARKPSGGFKLLMYIYINNIKTNSTNIEKL